MTRRRAVLITLAAGGLFALGSLAIPYATLHQTLIRVFGLVLPIHAGLIAALALFLAWHERRTIAAARGRLALGLGLGLLSATLAATLAPDRHRIYFDEDIYAQIGVSIAREGRAGMIDLALPEGGAWRGWRHSLNKQPNGFPLLVALVTRIAGIRDDAGRIVNLTMLIFLPLGLLLLRRELGGARRSGLAAALLLALWPELHRWGATGAVEPASAGLAVWSLWLAARAGRNRDPLETALAALLAALAIQMRPEGVLLLLPLIAAFLRRGAPWSAALPVLAATLLPHALLMAAMSDESWGATGPKFALAQIPLNAADNLGYWLAAAVRGTAFAPPRLVGLLALIGAGCFAFDARRAARPGLVLLVWLVPLFAIFLPFYAGSYFYGADIRFSLLVLAPIALLAGEALERAAAAAGRSVPHPAWRAATAGCGAVLVPLLLVAGPLLELGIVTHEARQARADHAAVEIFARDLPDSAIVISHTPAMWAMRGKAAIQLAWLERRPGLVEHLAQRHSLYYHVSYWDVGLSRHARTTGRFAGYARGEDLLARHPTRLVRRVEAEADWIFELRLLEIGGTRQTIQPRAAG